MDLREAAQQALEALSEYEKSYPAVADAFKPLRTALAEDVSETNFGNIVQVVDSTEADDIPDATKMIEPVAYVTGYFDGRCVIKTIDPVLLPAGMALYRSPPTSQESRQVEPVAYMSMCCSKGQTKPHSKTLFWPEQYTGRTEPVDAGAWGEERVVPLYTAPPKREPLTKEQIEFRFGKKPTRYMMFLIRSTERAHGIGGEE